MQCNGLVSSIPCHARQACFAKLPDPLRRGRVRQRGVLREQIDGRYLRERLRHGLLFIRSIAVVPALLTGTPTCPGVARLVCLHVETLKVRSQNTKRPLQIAALQIGVVIFPIEINEYSLPRFAVPWLAVPSRPTANRGRLLPPQQPWRHPARPRPALPLPRLLP
jgi:hypothetical protein